MNIFEKVAAIIVIVSAQKHFIKFLFLLRVPLKMKNNELFRLRDNSNEAFQFELVAVGNFG